MTTYPFRENCPKHRKNRKICEHYTSYKKTLRTDFNMRCGYCDDLDHNRIRSFVIDHFVPRNPEGWKHRIPPNKYTNLVYSCLFCNQAKGNTWPTMKAKVHNDGNTGFIMPTKRAYTLLFFRSADGSLQYDKNNPLAKYIYDELALWQPIHSLNWRFQKFLAQERELESIYNRTNDLHIKQQINDLKIARSTIRDTIDEIYNIKPKGRIAP